jgi:hypothetical protein
MKKSSHKTKDGSSFEPMLSERLKGDVITRELKSQYLLGLKSFSVLEIPDSDTTWITHRGVQG